MSNFEDEGYGDTPKPDITFFIDTTKDREGNTQYEATVYIDDEEIESHIGYDRAKLVADIEARYPIAMER